ncbi:MAG: hypothetical protein A2Z52_02465 [Candidatus Moranbacteria bacterium RBG_19FT_COMBO_42_6]|nr:MAG: hypothetical protein A2Z52_02465 [Candidatus Moranbacteria bacterium RBG_19FT_COMBO_42_6]
MPNRQKKGGGVEHNSFFFIGTVLMVIGMVGSRLVRMAKKAASVSVSNNVIKISRGLAIRAARM